MTHAHRSLLTGICTCLLSSFALAAAPAAPATAAAAPPGAKQDGTAKPAVTAEAAPAAKSEAPPAAKPDAAPQKMPSRAGSDARKCLKQPDNKGVRRCAEKYR
jgi:uncharacterized membrane protein